MRWQVTPESMRTATTMSGFASEIVAKEGVMRGGGSAADALSPHNLTGSCPLSGVMLPGISVNFMAIGVSAIGRVGLYPTVRDVFVGARGGDVAKPTPGDMFISGLLAGAIGYFIATPVFAQKTIIQAEAGLVDPKSGLLTTGAKAGSAPTSPNGWIAGMAAVAKKDGIGGWFKGSGPLVVRGATLSAGNQLGYDGFKTATSGVLPEGTRAADLRSHTSSRDTRLGRIRRPHAADPRLHHGRTRVHRVRDPGGCRHHALPGRAGQVRVAYRVRHYDHVPGGSRVPLPEGGRLLPRLNGALCETSPAVHAVAAPQRGAPLNAWAQLLAR